MDKINYPGSDSQSWNQHQILNPAKLSCLLRIVTLLADVVAETPPPTTSISLFTRFLFLSISIGPKKAPNKPLHRKPCLLVGF